MINISGRQARRPAASSIRARPSGRHSQAAAAPHRPDLEADAGVDVHIVQRAAGHQDPAVRACYLHPDVQAMLNAGTAFSA